MKLFFILIVIPIIASTDHYLELHNSQSKSLDNLTSNDNYYFNIQLENRKFPKVKIEFIMNSTCSKPFNEVNFYEYPRIIDIVSLILQELFIIPMEKK